MTFDTFLYNDTEGWNGRGGSGVANGRCDQGERDRAIEGTG